MHENHWGKPRELHSAGTRCMKTTSWTRAHTSHIEQLPQFTVGVKSHTHPGVVLKVPIWFHITLPAPHTRPPKAAPFHRQVPGLSQGKVPQLLQHLCFLKQLAYINYAVVYIRVLSYFHMWHLENFCVLCSCPQGEGYCTLLHSTAIFRNTPAM